MAVDLSNNEDLQRLFLLELLVDCIKFDHRKIDLDKSTLDSLKQTCARFNFLNFPVIEVCEEDFCQTREGYKSNDIVFKNGKSCFFSLSRLLKTECLKIGVTIIRKKNEPPPLVLGTTCIQLDKRFVNVLNNYNRVYEASETCQSLIDVFPIFDEKGIMIGTITLFVRLSCFGKAIITHFKIPQENETGYLFKNTNEPGQSSVAGQTLTPESPKDRPDSPKDILNSPGSPKSAGGKEQGTPDAVLGGRTNMSPDSPIDASGDMPGLGSPGGMALGIEPGGKQEMYPGDMPGMYAGGAPSTFPESISTNNLKDVTAYGALGDMGEIIPYSASKSLLNLRQTIDNEINKQYKELSVSINGHEFTINVLRKSRRKIEKNQKLQLCGRLPTKESSDSEESSVVRSEIVKMKEVEKKEMKINTTTRFNNVSKPEKITTQQNNATKTQPSQQQPQKREEIPFTLCECDIPLPKGFRVPETIDKTNGPNKGPIQSSMPAVPSKTATPPTAQRQSPPPSSVSPSVTQTSGTVASTVSLPVVKKIKDNKPVKSKETPNTYCLKPDCPMGFPWPPNVPLQTKVVKVPCCSPIAMRAGSVGIKGDHVVFQTTNGFTESFGNSPDQKKSAYVLKVGAANLPNNKCTKMILELPVPEVKIKNLKTNDIDTQYLESDIPISQELKPDTGKNLKESKKGKKKGKGKEKEKGKKK